MQSEEVIKVFREEIPKLKSICDHTIFGITHLDIEKKDGTLKQIGKVLKTKISCSLTNYNPFFSAGF
jgi:hypothetical protein